MPVVARTVFPPSPPVVPPFWVAKPVALPVTAADASPGIDMYTPVPAATATVASAAWSRSLDFLWDLGRRVLLLCVVVNVLCSLLRR
ncbi:hypothetical protein GCM10010365_07880 [Streptomyces poonensis]|uniref:Uncharacterized protein n=1 Tax=Streptomyces poonensis TaxID=68255 RepID=A0A918UCF8_9ACTN|nr:hypothetical protein GCM10010365_07880 [Streptomyces poonensis]GLJ87774.1 hypothetical protein GCM10017589_03740 [Streptomyces poonensis]